MKPCCKCGYRLDDEWRNEICTPCWNAIGFRVRSAMISLLFKLRIKT